MIIRCKTGEKVNTLKRYYLTNHWKLITAQYLQSELSKLCYKCRKSNTPEHFHHRTKKRIGNEKLTDLLPICVNCLVIDDRPPSSKKKAERRQLAPLGFNAFHLTDDQKNWMLSIRPHLRGYTLSKYYSQKAHKYKPSTKWINNQVKKACKWIRKAEKELHIDIENHV